ncbi:transcriptional regulator, IclR family [Pseudoxanthomonas sp. GM95]|uniref:IclR family transcriptional regulator n=1 Tax=Pseudoxanthomonas sp. GM95 TaxID=1881043 RepID=UPI0008D61992|nr:helix-turn-helix domain-containing protein [Pseudoxanthomonas sp. GM95]SEM26270.1 transcriptional regulator, IclR family [Pseudoxanthomonas sp. GM95]
MTPARNRHVQSVEHAMTLLQHLGQHADGLRLSELARATGLAKASVHALLATLADQGYVVRKQDRYTPGLRLTRLAPAAQHDADALRHAFAPALRAFGELCGEDCFLSVPGGTHSYLVLDALTREGQSFLPAPDPTRDALATSAAGKIFLAHDKRLHAQVLRQRAPDPAVLHDLAQVRERGFALDLQASERGLNCVALPLRLRGQVVAALSASGSAQRLRPERMQRTAGRAMRGLFDLLKH